MKQRAGLAPRVHVADQRSRRGGSRLSSLGALKLLLCGLSALSCAPSAALSSGAAQSPHSGAAAESAGSKPPADAQQAESQGATASQEAVEPRPGRPGLELSLTPEPQTPALRVRVVAYGDSAKLRVWRLAQAAPGDLLDLRQHFKSGESRTLQVSADGPGLKLQVPAGDRRESPGALTLEYRLRAPSFDARAPLAIGMDPNHFRAGGERALLLPDAYLDAPVPTRVVIQAAGLGAPQGAASSLGVGQRRSLQISGGGLRRSAFMAGPLGSARFDGPDGNDETAWVGYTAFDPRPVSAQIATFRSAAREYFADASSAPLTLLLLSDPRPSGEFDVARRSASILVHVGIGQPWDGPLSLAVSHQVVREWLGSKLTVTPARPGQSVLWFDEGFSRYLARELSFRMGQIEPDEYAAELEALTSVVLTSPHAGLGAQELLPKLKARDPEALTLEIARGALWASQLQADLARKGQRLDKILRDLYHAPAPVSAQQLIAATDAATGCSSPACSAEASFDKWILSPAAPVGAASGRSGNAAVSLPADALGVCFKSVPRAYPIYERGFGVTGGVVAELMRGGPAARAGLKIGDKLLSLRDRPGSASVPVELRVERAGQPLELRYLPQHGSIRGIGWAAQKHIPRDRCSPR